MPFSQLKTIQWLSTLPVRKLLNILLIIAVFALFTVVKILSDRNVKLADQLIQKEKDCSERVEEVRRYHEAKYQAQTEILIQEYQTRSRRADSLINVIQLRMINKNP